MHKPLPDTELWGSFLNGDAEAFAEIYNRHISELLNYGYRVTNDGQLIKDSIHNLFLHIWEHRERLSSTDSIKFYLFRALRNRILQGKREKHEFVIGDPEEADGNLSHELPVEQLIIDREIYQKQVSHIREAIRSLSPRQQEIVQLRYYHNLRTGQIAELMQISNQSARNLLSRSILQLRAFFEDLPRTWITSALVLFLI